MRRAGAGGARRIGRIVEDVNAMRIASLPREPGRSCAGCGKPLSRYNTGKRCQACVSADRDSILARPGRSGAPLVDRAKLAQLRHDRGWTQAMLADYAGLSTDIVRKLEQGAKRSARLSTLSALARALDVPVGVLLGDTPVSEPAGTLARQADGTGEQAQAAEPYRPTLLRALIAERRWQRFRTFEAQFRWAAREVAKREHDPDLAKLTVSSRQWERWYSGNVKTEPHPDACRVLEHMFGYPVQQLLATRENDSNKQHGPSTEDRHQYGSLQPLDKWARVRLGSSAAGGGRKGVRGETWRGTLGPERTKEPDGHSQLSTMPADLRRCWSQRVPRLFPADTPCQDGRVSVAPCGY
jgi:transcriptional regulator with XRE-family HTH domain